MIFLNLKLNNIYSFNDFKINFSYPQAVRNSLIPNETILDYKNFRYKKVNIFLGANASGKTTLMKSIWNIMSFLRSKDKNQLIKMINDINKDAYIEIDFVSFVTVIPTLNRFKIKLKNLVNDYDVLISHHSIFFKADASYQKMVKKLDIYEDNYQSYLELLNDVKLDIGWNVAMPGTEYDFDNVKLLFGSPEVDAKEYLNILNTVFKTLDPAIRQVTQSNDSKDAVVIEYVNGFKIIVQNNNKLNSFPYLSSGTKYGFNLADIIYSIKHHINNIYIIDEQFSYVNSDVEAAILSIMVSLLGPNEQLFITTHNSNILKMNFPFHSFNFMKKVVVDDSQSITCSCASEVEKRNNVSAKTIIDNDVFATAPDLSEIFNLIDTND